MVIVRLYETQHYSTEQDKFSKQAEIKIRNLSFKDKTVFIMLCNSHARFKMLKIPRRQTTGDSLLAFCLSLYQVTRNTLDTFVVFQKEVEYLLSIYPYKLAIIIPVGHV